MSGSEEGFTPPPSPSDPKILSEIAILSKTLNLLCKRDSSSILAKFLEILGHLPHGMAKMFNVEFLGIGKGNLSEGWKCSSVVECVP